MSDQSTKTQNTNPLAELRAQREALEEARARAAEAPVDKPRAAHPRPRSFGGMVYNVVSTLDSGINWCREKAGNAWALGESIAENFVMPVWKRLYPLRWAAEGYGWLAKKAMYEKNEEGAEIFSPKTKKAVGFLMANFALVAALTPPALINAVPVVGPLVAPPVATAGEAVSSVAKYVVGEPAMDLIKIYGLQSRRTEDVYVTVPPVTVNADDSHYQIKGCLLKEEVKACSSEDAIVIDVKPDLYLGLRSLANKTFGEGSEWWFRPARVVSAAQPGFVCKMDMFGAKWDFARKGMGFNPQLIEITSCKPFQQAELPAGPQAAVFPPAYRLDLS